MNTILQKRIEEVAENHEQCYNVGEEHGYLYTHKGDIKEAVIYGADFALQNQWISVEEALPEKNTMCFVRKETEVGVIYDSDYIDYEGKWFFNFNRTSIKSMVITHWMPIPSLEGDEK